MAKKKEKKDEYEVPVAAIEEMFLAMISVYQKNRTSNAPEMLTILGSASIKIMRLIAPIEGVELHEMLKMYGEWIASYPNVPNGDKN